jgi:hypothetical protein
MARYTGIGAVLGLTEEATYGEAAGTSLLIETPDFKGGAESLDASKEVLRPEFLDAPALRKKDITVLSESVSGGVSLNPRFNGKAWWAVLSHLCGEYSTKTGTGPYVHTMQFGGAITTTSAPETLGLQWTVDRGGTTGAVCYRGLKPTSVELTFAYNQPVEMTAEFMGTQAEATSGLTFSETAGNPLMVAPYTHTTQFLQFNSTAYDCASATIKMELPRTEVQEISATTAKAMQIDGFAKVSGSFETFALDETSSAFDTFVTDYRAQNGRELVYTLRGNDGTYANGLVLTIPKAVIVSNPTSHVDGPGVQRVTVEWEGYIDAGTTDYLVDIALTNSQNLDKGFKA